MGGLSAADRAIHLWALKQRDKNWGHIDRDGHRKSVSSLTVTEEGVMLPDLTALGETWLPASVAELRDLGRVADALAARYWDAAIKLGTQLHARGVLPLGLPLESENV